MEVAVGAATWLLGKVLKKLSDRLVAAYVSSSDLGLNFQEMKKELMYTQGLLHAAEGRDISFNAGLQGLLDDLGKKANQAEDVLDELHYFMIQDELDGTQEAAPDLGNGLRGQALHAHHTIQHTAGNWFSCFSCCRSQGDVAVFTNNTNSMSNNGHIDKLVFDRVDMSNRIKQLLKDIQLLCPRISQLLMISPSISSQPSIPASIKRPTTSAAIIEEKMFGRDDIFEKTIKQMLSTAQNSTFLSVLPIVGPGGIGKTTFTQYLFNDKMTQGHFPVQVWICVSTNFDLLNLTKEILSCLPAAQIGEDKIVATETTNLDQLQKAIALRLKSTRFLIVFDDIWEYNSTNEWEKLFPLKIGDTNGNMVLVTARFPKIVEMVIKEASPVELHGLEPEEFWKFFQVCVFGEIQDEHGNGDLIGIAREIADKLKCSPLAAKTVGRLLNKKQCWEHWIAILQNKEWLNQNHDDDIIPALKISYDYLPFHLKKCFQYCALFPEDYKYNSSELGCFFISIGITDSSNDQNGKIEDIGSKYLDELLDNGFMMKTDDNHYVMHDLLHQLSQSVSSKECAHINCSDFKADGIPSSICHLSISMQDKYIENFEVEMDKLKRRIDIGSLQSLMIIGQYGRASIVNILKSTFADIKCLRVLFISMISPNCLPPNFSRLVHLRYLKIETPYYSKLCLPGTISRFYHLKFLDLPRWRGRYDLPKGINRLVNLTHFAAPEELHSFIPEVGKMKLLQELKRFHVKKDSVGFELRELGKLKDLGGRLCIHGLQNLKNKEEANGAKLREKRNLVGLGLAWDKEYPTTGVDIIQSLQPHSNIGELRIVNHCGFTCPSWLCDNVQLKNLETLDLGGVSWATLPPIGLIYHLRVLKLRNIAGICQFGTDFVGGVTEKSFRNLKEVQFDEMPEFVEWVEGTNSHFFSSLETIKCTNCPKLVVLPLSEGSGSSVAVFPKLCHLHTRGCLKLCLPPLPHTPKLSLIKTDCLNYSNARLHIKMPCEIAFQNLGEVKDLTIEKASLISFKALQQLHPLRKLTVNNCEDIFLRWLDDGIVVS